MSHWAIRSQGLDLRIEFASSCAGSETDILAYEGPLRPFFPFKRSWRRKFGGRASRCAPW